MCRTDFRSVKYSIDELEPDVIQAPLWRLDSVQNEPTPYLDRDYDHSVIVAPWYLRRGSARVLRRTLTSR